MRPSTRQNLWAIPTAMLWRPRFGHGVLVTDYDGVGAVPERKKQFEPERGPRPESGYIALQNHDPTAVVTFKEISLEPLKIKKPKK